MKTNYTIFLAACLIGFLALPNLLNGQNKLRVGQYHAYISPGSSFIRHADFSESININDDISQTRGFGFQLGGSYRFIFGDRFGIGAGLEFASLRSTLDLNTDGEPRTISNGSGYSLLDGSGNSVSNSFILTDSITSSQNVGVNTLSLVIPLYLELTSEKSSGYLFAEGGLKFSFLSNSSSNNSGYAEYAGDFSANFPVESGDEFNLVLDDLEEFGFTGKETDAANGLTPEFGGFVPNYWLSLAYAIPMGSSGTFLSIGPVIQGSLGNILSNSLGESQLGNIREGNFDFVSASHEATTANISYLGLKVGMYIDRYNVSVPVSPEPLIVNLELYQSRNGEDKEFERIKEILKSQLYFVGTLEGNGRVRADGTITFDKNNTSPNSIKAEFQPRNKSVKIKNTLPLQGEYNISIELDNSIYPQQVALRVSDPGGNRVNGFTVVNSFEGERRNPVKMNSGESLKGLYHFPGIDYELDITHPCYEELTTRIKGTDNTAFSTGVPLVMNPSGNMMRVEVPYERNSSIPEDHSLSLTGKIVANNSTGEVSSIGVNAGILVMDGGCNLDGNVSQITSLRLEKRKGYDLVVNGREGNWRDDFVNLRVQNGRVQEMVEEVPLKVVNMFYADVSYLEERGALLDSMEAITRRTNDRDKYEVYTAVGNDYPVEITSYDELEQNFLAAIATMGANSVPDARKVLNQLKEVMPKDQIRPDRRKVVLTYFLSETIYKFSKEIIIGELLSYLGEAGEPDELRIITLKKIPEDERWIPANIDPSKVKYDDLSSK